jgi:hypothetical protein
VSAGLLRIARLLLALAAAFLLGLLVIRVSATNALMEMGPESGAMLSPDHSGVLISRAYQELRRAGVPSAETTQGALEGFDSAPLSEVPLLIAAREALARDEGERADRLLAVALRRNPRSRPGLLLQLDRHVRAGREREAAALMPVLARLFSVSGPLLVSELARMAADPENRPTIRRAMETDPNLRTDLLETLARRGADPDLIVDLAGPPAAGEDPPPWHGLLVEAFVERGEIGRALEIWQRLAGVERDGGVYDPGFAGLPGPAPFNWAFETSGDGFAEPAANGLQAEYYGRNDATLASQLLALSPGRYSITFEVEGQAEGADGRLSWTVTCRTGPGGLEVPITGVDYAPRRISGSFVVPADGCASQWLRLVGQAAEFPKTQQVVIRDLRIAPEGRP